MKTTLHMFMIAFLLSLAGVLSAAWGAESVASLISQGEEIINRINTHKAAFDAGMKKIRHWLVKASRSPLTWNS